MSNFETNPRDYALELVENGVVSAENLLLCALKYISHDDVRDMLDCNELSPRFEEDDDDSEEYEIDSEKFAREWFWDNHPEYLDHYEEGKHQNDYNAEIRTAWVNAIDHAVKDGLMSSELADDITL